MPDKDAKRIHAPPRCMPKAQMFLNRCSGVDLKFAGEKKNIPFIVFFVAGVALVMGFYSLGFLPVKMCLTCSLG